MTPDWLPLETDRQQDHVIAHVVGATVLGSLATDQTSHLLLDIGFIWTVYVDGQMSLLTESLTISELDFDESVKAQLRRDVRLLHDDGRDAVGLLHFIPAPADCAITDVEFYAQGARRLFVIKGEAESLALEASLVTGETILRAVR